MTSTSAVFIAPNDDAILSFRADTNVTMTSFWFDVYVVLEGVNDVIQTMSIMIWLSPVCWPFCLFYFLLLFHRYILWVCLSHFDALNTGLRGTMNIVPPKTKVRITFLAPNLTFIVSAPLWASFDQHHFSVHRPSKCRI